MGKITLPGYFKFTQTPKGGVWEWVEAKTVEYKEFLKDNKIHNLKFRNSTK